MQLNMDSVSLFLTATLNYFSRATQYKLIFIKLHIYLKKSDLL